MNIGLKKDGNAQDKTALGLQCVKRVYSFPILAELK